MITKILASLLIVLCILYVSEAVETCPSKQEAATCIFKTRGMLSESQVDKIIKDKLPWYTRWAYTAFGGTRKVFNDCDTNKDGYISEAEAMESRECLNTCDIRKNVVELLQCS